MFEEKESPTLELKAGLYDRKNKQNDSFLKTVNAFANFQTGRILFGIEDDGTVKGLDNIMHDRLSIESAINDNIHPQPQYKITAIELEGKEVLELEVFKGEDAPYLYKGIAYRRNDTASRPLDSIGLKHLISSSNSMDYDRTLSHETELNFSVLEKAMQEELGIGHLTKDILRTLGLLRNEQYTIAGELLADTNNNLRSATNIVRFGDTISIFLERQDLQKISLLEQYTEASALFQKWYAPYEEIVGSKRVKKIQIPEKAFREALANALVHRRYDVNSAIQIAMFKDRIEITSPGGLLDNLSREDFLYGQASLLRNMTIAEVFHRLNIIEKFGTGIHRIRMEYEGYSEQAQFQITDNSISVILPVVGSGFGIEGDNLSEKILSLLGSRGAMSRAQLEKATGYGKTKIYETLNLLKSSNRIEAVGKGRGTRYKLNNK